MQSDVEANARLTGSVALVLLLQLAVLWVTGLAVSGLLTLHALIGLAVLPPVLLKLGSVGYRFVRYYAGDPGFRAAGPPETAMRVLGAVLVVLTVAVLGSGVELWLFGSRFGRAWVPVHHGTAYLWFAAMTVHVLVYARRATGLAAADWRDRLRGAVARRSLVVASVLLGACLLAAMLPFASPFTFGPLSGT